MPRNYLRALLTLIMALCWGEPVLAAPSSLDINIPDTALVDQEGRAVRLKSGVLGDKTVAINFVFTACEGICPILGTTFSKLQERLGERLGKDISLVSITIDPATDTPARLKEWGAKFGARTGWTLLTGEQATVSSLLKTLGAGNHDAPMMLLGNPRTGEWVRSYDDITAPEKLHATLLELAARNAPAAKPSAAHRYFGDTELIDQDGRKLKLYEDLMKGKIVVVNTFFSSCQGVCTVLLPKVEKLAALAGDRLGRDVAILSISVDPLVDTPAKLKAYAEGVKAKPGWHFLTGDPDAVGRVLAKFGSQVDAKESHSNLLMMGNDRTGLWKKVFGLAEMETVAAGFRSVLDDEGEAKP